MKVIIILILSISTLTSFSQTDSTVLAKMDKLFNKAIGKKVPGFFVGQTSQILSQSITKDTILLKEKQKNPNSSTIKRYPELNWNNLSEIKIIAIEGNYKVKIVRFKFKMDSKTELLSVGKEYDGEPYMSEFIELYILPKDENEMQALLNQLYKE